MLDLIFLKNQTNFKLSLLFFFYLSFISLSLSWISSSLASLLFIGILKLNSLLILFPVANGFWTETFPVCKKCGACTKADHITKVWPYVQQWQVFFTFESVSGNIKNSVYKSLTSYAHWDFLKASSSQCWHHWLLYNKNPFLDYFPIRGICPDDLKKMVKEKLSSF